MSHVATVIVSEVNGCVIFGPFLFSLGFQFHVVWYIVTRTALPSTSQTQLLQLIPVLLLWDLCCAHGCFRTSVFTCSTEWSVFC